MAGVRGLSGPWWLRCWRWVLLCCRVPVPWLLRGSVLGVALALWLCHQANSRGFTRPNPRQPFVRVLFEMEKSALFLPVKRFAQRTDAPFDYETFFIWTQRLGYIPGVHFDAGAVDRGENQICWC
jgi:hypothetical protein